uniref:TLC domain-containing protein n=1 Tax=Alexandrium andersonii TaxID=327968 RepID=A0A7S2HGZ6_9DINO
MECSSVDISVRQAVSFVLDRRLTYLLILMTLTNLLFSAVDARVLPKLGIRSDLHEKRKHEFGVRLVQLIAGLLLSVSGYGFVLFYLLTGCCANEVYLFYFGSCMLALDLHEWIRRWPLRLHVLGHHIAVFFLCLSMVEFDGYDNRMAVERSTLITMLVSNVSITWVTDIFHVVFKLSKRPRTIKRARLAFLVLAIFRLANVGILFTLAGYNFAKQAWPHAGVSTFFGFAYSYVTYKATSFVWWFDADAYVARHCEDPMPEVVANPRK